MMVPRSWRKKISEMVKGARHSAAPLANPMRIRAVNTLPYEAGAPAHPAQAVYMAKVKMYSGRRPYLIMMGIHTKLPMP